MITPRTYRYINSDNDRASKDCLNENELFDGINDEKFIIQNEISRKYLVFNSYGDFKDWFSANPDQRCLHELVRGCSPQKLKFDIDILYATADLSEFEDTPKPIKYEVDDEELMTCETLHMDPYEEYNNALTQYNKGINERRCHLAFLKFIECVKKTFQQLYTEKLLDSEICISDASDESKFSKHVVLGYRAANASECKYFTSELVLNIPDHYRFMIDQSVNKSIQLFRMPECHKRDSNRIKRITSDHTFDDMIVSIGDDYILPKFSKEKLVGDHENIAPEKCTEIIQELTEHTLGHKFYKQKNNMLFYSRVMPSHCQICKRTHESDNTLFISVHKSRMIIHCRHAINETVNKPKNIVVCRTTPTIRDRENEIKELCERDVVDDKFPSKFHQVCTNDRFIKPLKFHGDSFDTILVKSQMGSGKTVRLINLIDGLPKEVYVICISFRRSFSSEIISKLGSTFLDYRNVKGDIINAPRLVIQYESLNRLRLPIGKQILLIVDESESVIAQINHKSNNFEKTKQNFEIFQWLLTYSSKVLCMDAGMSTTTFDCIKKTRNSVIAYNNEYKKTDCRDIHYGNKDQYLQVLYDAMKNAKNEAIVICASSKNEADVFATKAAQLSPESTIKYYNRDSTIEERRDFEDVNKAWANTDVLIYTSTISAGISFDNARFHKIFGFFDAQSCCYRTCSQMLGRIRKVESHQYHIYIKKSNAKLPETFDEIADAILRRDDIIKNISNSSNQLNCFINKFGQREFKNKDLYYCLYIGNLVHKAQSQNRFIEHFINLRKASGNEQIVYTENGAPQSHTKETSKIKADIKLGYAEAVLSANMDMFTMDMLDSDELSYEEKIMVKQYRFAEFYNDLDITTITPEIFIKYDASNVRNIYKSLNGLNNPDGCISDIVKLYGKNHDKQKTSMELMAEGNWKFERVFVCELLNKLFNNYTDRHSRIVNEEIARTNLEENIDSVVNIIKKDVNLIAYVFEKKKCRIIKEHKNLKEKLMLVNSLISSVIGAKIVGINNGTGRVVKNFQLETEGLFIYNNEDCTFVIKK